MARHARGACIDGTSGRTPPGHEQEALQRLLADGVPLQGDHVACPGQLAARR